MRLSKSQYIRGLQCVKSLWLRKYNKEVLTPPDSSAEAIFSTGNIVGALACQLFPNGVEIKFDSSDYEGMISKTKQLIDNGLKNIYEASFEYGGIFAAIDILHINDDKSVEIYEVKSSTDVKDVYLNDASIQYYILKGLGYDVKSVNVVHINNKYVRQGDLEIDKLFSIVDVSEEVLELQYNIPEFLKHFESHLANKELEPYLDIGEHCFNPYECDAVHYCWKAQRAIPDYSVFDISRLRKDKKFALYKAGITSICDIEDVSSYSTAQQVQIESEKRQEEIIDKEAIKAFLETLEYPLYHLDFETFQQAVPEWDGISPFMQIPFQYSLHVEHKNGELEHYEFLAEEGKDPRYELAKHLVQDIPRDVTVLAYNMGFEKGVIRKLAAQFDELHDHLMAIHDNVKDLMTPFQKKDYYTPAMKGSYSIKYILPALVPEMAMAYKELDGVQNGGEAMQTYAKLSTMEDKQEVQRLRKALLEYCKLDTLAMVKVLEKLKKSIG